MDGYRSESELETAAREFVSAWDFLLPGLGDDYSCTLTCNEANTAHRLFRAAGDPDGAEQILEMHSEDCDETEEHPSS